MHVAGANMGQTHRSAPSSARGMGRGTAPTRRGRAPTDKAQAKGSSEGWAYIMVYPPLTLRVWPVMKLAASEAKNTTALATSRAVPMRRRI
jgi:hypothetical protein